MGQMLENDNGVIKWNDILNQEPVMLNFTINFNSILHGNGHVEDITSKNGWYLHYFDGTNNYLGYTKINIDDGTEVWSEQAKIQASDKAQDDNFGISIGISGDYAIVGAPHEDAGGSDAGAAYIFKRTGTAWAEQAKLMASDAAADDWFGQTVYIKDEYAIVGATGEDTVAGDAGAAYIFKRSGTTWTEVKKITASDAEAYDSFGSSVAIDGTTAVVGAPNEDTGGADAGVITSNTNPTTRSLTFDGNNKLTVTNFDSTDKLWPPSDGTWNITTDNSTTSEWTISGASYGNGSYKATSSVGTNGIFRAYQAFEGTETGNTSCWQIMATAGILSIELPESVIIQYALLNRNYNLSEDQDASPKDFTFEGSSDGSSWVVLDTVTGNGGLYGRRYCQ